MTWTPEVKRKRKKKKKKMLGVGGNTGSWARISGSGLKAGQKR